PHLRGDDSVRHGSFAPGGSGAHAERSARTLHGRGLAGASARPGGTRARSCGHRRALPSALRPRRGRGPLSQVGAGRAEGRVLLRPLSRLRLRVVLLPEELRPAGLPLAPAGRRYRAGPGRDRAANGRPHAGSPVLAGRAARDGSGHSHRRRLLLAGARGQRARARRRLEPGAGASRPQEGEDDRAARARSHLSRPRPGLLGNRQTGAGCLSLRARRACEGESAMKDGLRFVDSDMHIMEPPDLFDRYLDPKFKDRISVPVGADGRPKRGAAGLTIIDGLPTSDVDLQQYRKRVRNSGPQSTQPLSGSRLFDTGRLDFAIARDYDPVAQVMGMEMEGVDIAVNYPTAGLALLGRDNMDPQLSL